MVASAKKHVEILENLGFYDIVISLKGSNILETIAAYRLASKTFPYPLHLGITEAGYKEISMVRSSAGLSPLLLEGIGDTIRISISGDPKDEIKVCKQLLHDCGLYPNYPTLVACPTCGRKYEDANEEHIQQAISDLENEKINNDEQVKQININIEQLKQEQSKIEIVGKELANEILQVSALIEEHKKQVDNKDNDRKELVEKKQKVEFDKNKCQREINELKNKKEQLLKSQTNNIDEFKTMINKLNDEIGNIDSRLTELDQEYNKNNDYVSVIKNSIQMVTKEFRTYLLQNSLQYLNKLLKDYSSNLFSNNQDIIKIEEDDTKLNIKLGNATYESLSGGEKTRVNIALLLAQKSLASIIGNISCNIIILDEILGYCDSQAEENVINLLTQELETLESIYMVSHKEIPIGYDTQLVIIKDKSGLSRVMGR